MDSKHRDPQSSPSVRPLTPRTSRGVGRQTSTAPTTPRKSSGGTVPNLIVARSLYKVLEEIQEHPPASKPAHPRGGQSSRPNFLFCYLCGLQFSAGSLPIHQPQCYVKKLIEWERMDPARRGPRPLDPERHEEYLKEQRALGGSGNSGSGKLKGRDLDRFNEMQIEHFNTNMLLKCDTCGRTFLPDRLEVHLRSCKPGSAGASKPVARETGDNAQAQKTLRRPHSTSPCAVSNRKPREVAAAVGERHSVSSPAVHTSHKINKQIPSSVSCKASCGADSTESPGSPEVEPLAATIPCMETAISVPNTDDDDGDFEAINNNLGSGNKKNNGGDDAGKTHATTTTNTAVAAAEAKRPMALNPSEVREIIRAKPPEMVATDLTSMVVKRRSVRKESKSNPRESTPVSERRDSMNKSDSLHVEDNITNANARTAPATVATASHSGDSQTFDDDTTFGKSTVKIPLNNVSHFKNVPSRLQVDLNKKETLPRCRYCSRTFNAERLEKHEDVCLERRRPTPRPAATAAGAKTTTTTATTPVTTNTTATGTKKRTNVRREPQEAHTGVPARNSSQSQERPQELFPVVSDAQDGNKSVPSFSQPRTESKQRSASMGTPKQHFCFECGAKLRAEPQRFCSECGTKLLS